MHKSVASLSEPLLSLSQRRSESLLNLFVGVRLKLHWILSDPFVNLSPNSSCFHSIVLNRKWKILFFSLGPNLSPSLHSFLFLLAQPDLASSLQQPSWPAPYSPSFALAQLGCSPRPAQPQPRAAQLPPWPMSRPVRPSRQRPPAPQP